MNEIKYDDDKDDDKQLNKVLLISFHKNVNLN